MLATRQAGCRERECQHPWTPERDGENPTAVPTGPRVYRGGENPTVVLGAQATSSARRREHHRRPRGTYTLQREAARNHCRPRSIHTFQHEAARSPPPSLLHGHPNETQAAQRHVAPPLIEGCGRACDNDNGNGSPTTTTTTAAPRTALAAAPMSCDNHGRQPPRRTRHQPPPHDRTPHKR